VDAIGVGARLWCYNVEHLKPDVLALADEEVEALRVHRCDPSDRHICAFGDHN